MQITLFLFPLAPFQAECDALEQEATLSGRLEILDTKKPLTSCVHTACSKLNGNIGFVTRLSH